MILEDGTTTEITVERLFESDEEAQQFINHYQPYPQRQYVYVIGRFTSKLSLQIAIYSIS